MSDKAALLCKMKAVAEHCLYLKIHFISPADMCKIYCEINGNLKWLFWMLGVKHYTYLSGSVHFRLFPKCIVFTASQICSALERCLKNTFVLLKCYAYNLKKKFQKNNRPHSVLGHNALKSCSFFNLWGYNHYFELVVRQNGFKQWGNIEGRRVACGWVIGVQWSTNFFLKQCFLNDLYPLVGIIISMWRQKIVCHCGEWEGGKKE